MYKDDVFASKSSVVRFLMTMNRIHEGNLICHQTLTFPDVPDSDVTAKQALYQLLDVVGKRCPNLASIYVMEYSRSGALHFHVIFVFFREEDLPFKKEDMRKFFGRYVFKCWNRILGGRAIRQANLMRIHEKSPRTAAYLAKSVRPVWHIPSHSNRKTRWWGIRGRGLFNKYGTAPDEEAALKEFRFIFPKGVRRAYRRRCRPSLNLGHAQNWSESYFRRYLNQRMSRLASFRYAAGARRNIPFRGFASMRFARRVASGFLCPRDGFNEKIH